MTLPLIVPILLLSLAPAAGTVQSGTARPSPALRDPGAPEMNRRAPDEFVVRLDTSKGPIDVEVRREWAPRGADRFYNLVEAGYYDDSRFSRVIAGRWAQFGISGDPAMATTWRSQTFPDEEIPNSVDGAALGCLDSRSALAVPRLFAAGALYLIGYCHMRGDVRMFAVDRIWILA